MSSNPILMLEHRMVLFLAHTCGQDAKKVRPLYIALTNGASRQAVAEILMRRLSQWEFLKEHMNDNHDYRGCGVCSQLYDRARNHESRINEFVHDHLTLIAECGLEKGRRS